MTTVLIISGALIWWWPGLLSSQLIWRALPDGNGTFKYEWGPFARLGVFLFSLFGPGALYFYSTHVAANKIEEKRAREQVREEMKQERNRLRVEYQKGLLAEAGIKADDEMDEFELDAELE